MAGDVNTPGMPDDSDLAAASERLAALVAPEFPCDPAPWAVAAWVARGIEAGFVRAYAINVETCVGPQCAAPILAELGRRGAAPADIALVSEALAGPGASDALRGGPLAAVLADALHAGTDQTLRDVSAAAKAHARCVRLGHEVVILFDHAAEFDWLYSGAQHKVRDALAKAGCYPQAAVTQELDLAGGGKLFLPGYKVVAARRRGGLQAQVDALGGDASSVVPLSSHDHCAGGAEGAGLAVVLRPAVARRRRPPTFGLLARAAQSFTRPARALQSVELNASTLSCLAREVVGRVLAWPVGLMVAALLAASTLCLGLAARDVYRNLSGEVVAPRRPEGFYIGQYNKAGPWGTDLRPYGLYVPPHFEGQSGPFPLIVYLHGYGERRPGDLFAAGLPLSIATRYNHGSKNGRFEFVGLFLNDPTGYWLSETPAGLDAIKVLDYVMSRHNIDPHQVFLTGASAGGGGVWHFAEKYPNRWAAVAPLGAVHTPNVSQVVHIPTWIFHGERDETAPIMIQRTLFKDIQKAGGDVKFTEFRGKGHTVSAETYDTPDVFKWFASKRLSQ